MSEVSVMSSSGEKEELIAVLKTIKEILDKHSESIRLLTGIVEDLDDRVRVLENE